MLLVWPNPGFEEVKNCPYTLNYIEAWIHDWHHYKGSPDYYNSCASNANFGTPKNIFGYQKPKSGEGYIAIIPLSPKNLFKKNGKIINWKDTDYREAVQCKLNSELIKGKQYSVGFYLSVSELGCVPFNMINVYLLNGNLQEKDWMGEPFILTNRAELSYTYDWKDTLSWQKMEATYTAKGGENLLIIGVEGEPIDIKSYLELLKKEGLNYRKSGLNSYIYIDDVFVYPIE